ncbi:unnamed protein product, partial [Ixodes pacificus]
MSTIVFVTENQATANENNITHLSAEVNLLIAGSYFVYSVSHFSPILNYHFLKKTGKYAKEAWNTVATHAVCSELNAVFYFLSFSSLVLMCLDLVLLCKGWQVPAEIKPFQRRDLIVQK